MPLIFINYRNRTHAGYAALLDHVLASEFGTDAIFRDKRSVAPGDDFVIGILAGLRRCALVLAVVGAQWPDAGPSTGVPGPVDWVLAEITEALACGIRIVPILVDGAALPVPAALPPQIAPLARCQALLLRAESIDADLGVIVARVRVLLAARR